MKMKMKKKSIWTNPFRAVDFGYWFWKFCWFCYIVIVVVDVAVMGVWFSWFGFWNFVFVCVCEIVVLAVIMKNDELMNMLIFRSCFTEYNFI